MKLWLVIFLGGGIGSMARYGLAQKMQSWFATSYPVGILTVNIIGGFLIGLFWILLLERLAVSPLWRAGLMIGFLGGFTTFSSFSLDTVNLLVQRHYVQAISYIFLSVLLSLGTTGCGIMLARRI